MIGGDRVQVVPYTHDQGCGVLIGRAGVSAIGIIRRDKGVACKILVAVVKEFLSKDNRLQRIIKERLHIIQGIA